MDLRVILVGLTAWLVISVIECDAAPLTGQQDTQAQTREPLSSIEADSGMQTVLNKEVESPLEHGDLTDIGKEHSTNSAKTYSTMPSDLNEDKIEEKEEDGVIRGKYSYVEDGIPVQLEYKAIPQVKFEVTKYMKGSTILPLPDINNSNENIAGFHEDDPEYEHASVIGRHSKTITRKTRSLTNQKYHQSESGEYETGEITENDETEGDKKVPVDASYKFGFSADGQTRNEESDADGNVEGSYSYIGENGMITKVEYEAGAGKGFNVKNVLQYPNPINFDQSSDQSNAEIELPSSQGIKSDEHVISQSHQTSPENQEENDDQNINGSYSFSYATPDQWREESVDDNGNLNSRSSFIRDNRITQAQINDLTNGFIDKELKPRMTHFIEQLLFKKIHIENTKTSADGSYSFSYETPKLSDMLDKKETVNTGISADSLVETPTETMKDIEKTTPESGNLSPTSGGENDQQYIESSLTTEYNEDLGINSNQRTEFGTKSTHHLTPSTNFAQLQGLKDKVKEKENVMENSSVKQNIPTSMNTLPDGSYNFAYGNKEQLRKESVDTKGNVFSSYQHKTKDGGKTVVVFKRRIVKDSMTTGNDPERQFKRHTSLEYMNRAQQLPIVHSRGSVKYQRQPY